MGDRKGRRAAKVDLKAAVPPQHYSRAALAPGNNMTAPLARHRHARGHDINLCKRGRFAPAGSKRVGHRQGSLRERRAGSRWNTLSRARHCEMKVDRVAGPSRPGRRLLQPIYRQVCRWTCQQQTGWSPPSFEVRPGDTVTPTFAVASTSTDSNHRQQNCSP